MISQERYRHSLQVADTAAQLAERWDLVWKKARIADLVFDCGRFPSRNILLIWF